MYSLRLVFKLQSSIIFDKCLQSWIHHCNVILNSFSALGNLCFNYSSSSWLWQNHSCVYWLDSFVFSWNSCNWIWHCAAFLDWHLSLSNMELRFVMSFMIWSISLLSLNQIPLYGCTMICYPFTYRWIPWLLPVFSKYK